MVTECTRAAINVAITVKVNELYVTRRANKLIAILESYLVNRIVTRLNMRDMRCTFVYNGGFFDIPAAVIGEVFLLIKTVGYVAPDVAVGTSRCESIVD